MPRTVVLGADGVVCGDGLLRVWAVGVVDRLLVDVTADGRVSVSRWLDGELPSVVGKPVELGWPLAADELEDLRWYLEDYLRAPFGVYEQRGPRVAARLSEWGQRMFSAVFAAKAARDAYVTVRTRAAAGEVGARPEIVVRSAQPDWLALPWELLADPAQPSPVALDAAAVSRSLPSEQMGQAFPVGGERLRVLMVISRPGGTGDVGYRMIARPLLDRLDAVRGVVELVVLRPPTLQALVDTLQAAQEAGEPFQVVHFDGHGVLSGRRAGLGAPVGFDADGSGMLVFEKPGGGADEVAAEEVARVLGAARVPVVVLNACQSGAIGKQLEAAVATRLLAGGASSVVAMAYSVYAVAAAEFMTAFYERLFAGERVSDAVTAGRARLAGNALRPSPKGKMPLSDWVVPVHYLRRDAHFPHLRQTATKARGGLSLDAALDRIRERQTSDPGDPLAPRDKFVGRDGLFYTLEAALGLQRVVVLHGPGGTGKTELAKAFGRWWRDTGGVDHPEWVIWHSLEPGVDSFGLDGVLSTIGRQVSGAEFAGLDAEQRRQMVRDRLARHRALVVLDNFESVHSMPDPTSATPPLDTAGCGEIRDFLAEVAASGTSGVIITSRSPETWLEEVRRIPVAGLSTEEAFDYAEQLLCAYPNAAARRAQRVFGELMAWLGGHPLSMRLTLPQLDTTDPDVLLAGLRGITTLPGGEDGDRSTSLPACITYSITHLHPATRRLLAAVCLFHGVADAVVLDLFSQQPGVPERFRDLNTETWAQTLDRAAGVGLLTPLGAGMYSIHPALPSYLADRWRAEDPDHYSAQRAAAYDALLDAHAEFASWLMQEIQIGDAALAFALIDRQRRTLSELLGYALASGNFDRAHNIVEPLDLYWDVRGLSVEARGWGDRARLILEDPDGTRPDFDTPAGELWLLLVRNEANSQQRAGQLDAAEDTNIPIRDALLAQPTSPQQQRHLAVLYHQLSSIALERGRWDEAEERCHKSLTISEGLSDRLDMATNYHQLGMIAELRGQWDAAEEWYHESLTINQDLGNRTNMAGAYHHLGRIAQQRGQWDAAEDWYHKSLTISEDLGDRRGMATAYHQLGMIAELRGWLDDAEECYHESLTISEDLGNRPLTAGAYHQLGRIAELRGQWDAAEDWYHKSLTINQDLGNPLGIAGTYHQLGWVAHSRKRLKDAKDWYHKSLTISEDLGDRHSMASIYHHLGRIAQDRWRLKTAEDWYHKSLTISEDLDYQFGMAATYHQLGILAHFRGRWDDAEDWYHKSLNINVYLGDRSGRATSFCQLGMLAKADGRLLEALEWMVRCVTVFDEFPHPLTGPAPRHLARLTTALGVNELRACWLEITGHEPPPAVVTLLESHPRRRRWRPRRQRRSSAPRPGTWWQSHR